MKNIFRIAILIFFIGCNVSQPKPFVLNHKAKRELKREIVNRLNNNNSIKYYVRDFDIWFNVLCTLNDNRIVCNFGETSSNSSRKNIFLYDGFKIKMLNGTDEDMLAEIQMFLDSSVCSIDDKETCMQKIRGILSSHEGDAF